MEKGGRRYMGEEELRDMELSQASSLQIPERIRVYKVEKWKNDQKILNLSIKRLFILSGNRAVRWAKVAFAWAKLTWQQLQLNSPRRTHAKQHARFFLFFSSPKRTRGAKVSQEVLAQANQANSRRTLLQQGPVAGRIFKRNAGE